MTTGPDHPAKYQTFLLGACGSKESDDGPGFWLTCDSPFEDGATNLLRSAIRASKPVAVLGNYKRIPAQPVPTTA